MCRQVKLLNGWATLRLRMKFVKQFDSFVILLQDVMRSLQACCVGRVLVVWSASLTCFGTCGSLIGGGLCSTRGRCFLVQNGKTFTAGKLPSHYAAFSFEPCFSPNSCSTFADVSGTQSPSSSFSMGLSPQSTLYGPCTYFDNAVGYGELSWASSWSSVGLPGLCDKLKLDFGAHKRETCKWLSRDYRCPHIFLRDGDTSTANSKDVDSLVRSIWYPILNPSPTEVDPSWDTFLRIFYSSMWTFSFRPCDTAKTSILSSEDGKVFSFWFRSLACTYPSVPSSRADWETLWPFPCHWAACCLAYWFYCWLSLFYAQARFW